MLGGSACSVVCFDEEGSIGHCCPPGVQSPATNSNDSCAAWEGASGCSGRVRGTFVDMSLSYQAKSQLQLDDGSTASMAWILLGHGLMAPLHTLQAVKPIALAKVMAISRMIADEHAGKGVSMSGIGGVETGGDAAEFILLGSDTVQVREVTRDVAAVPAAAHLCQGREALRPAGNL